MLVLTRKQDESIMIGDEIEVSVLAVGGGKVRIGIEAPRAVSICRKEIYPGGRSDGAGQAAARRAVEKELHRLKSG